MAEQNQAKIMANADQALSWIADTMPGIWRRMYDNLIKEGFTTTEALDIVKVYIRSNGTAPAG